ncbi:MAG TPA: DsbA family protein [Candidatus Paceibacterota bacterium]
MDEKERNYAIPGAIVIAGLIIAASLLYVNRSDKTVTQQPTNNGSVASAELLIPDITAEDHILGNPEADFVIVEYSDTECPFCKDFHYSLHSIIDTYGKEGKVAWVYRNFPIVSLHSKAPQEAEAIECAAKLGGNDIFWNYLDNIFDTTPSNNGLPASELPRIAERVGLNKNAFEDCLNSGLYTDKVRTQVQEAQDAGGRGTPFSIIVAKKSFNKETIDFVTSASAQLPPRTIVISKDESRIALNGALPIGFLNLFFDTALGRN